MYQTLARNVITSFLESNHIPSVGDLSLAEHPDVQTRNCVFVTLYKDGRVVASSGRVHPIQANTVSECIDNAVLALRDARAEGLLLSDLPNVKIRVDVIASNDRRVVGSYEEVNPREEGIILLSQNLNTLSVVLPKIVAPDISARDLFTIACTKAGIPVSQPPSDYVLYALRSQEYSDF